MAVPTAQLQAAMVVLAEVAEEQTLATQQEERHLHRVKVMAVAQVIL